MGRPAVLLIALAACSDGGGRMVAADAPISETGCTLRWKVTPTGGTAVVEGGSLKLATAALPSGIAVIVEQTGITAKDFTASFTVTAWMAGGSGAYLQALMSQDEPDPRVAYSAGIGTSPSASVTAAVVQLGGAVETQPTTATSATFRFERVTVVSPNVMATATVTTADATATVTNTLHGQAPQKISLQLGTNDGALGPTSVEITDFMVTAPDAPEAAAAASDSFDCDSLRM